MKISTPSTQPPKANLLPALPPPPSPDPEDGYWAASKLIARGALGGAVEGAGYAGLASLADSLGPSVGLPVRLAMTGVGAAVGVKHYGKILSSEFEFGPVLGNLMAGVLGAGKVYLMTSNATAASLTASAIGGAVTGSVFGILDAGRQAR